MSITTSPQVDSSVTVHPFAHLPTMYWLTNPLSENTLMRKGWDKATIEAMDDAQLAALMKSTGSSHEWMQYLSPTRISTLLSNRFAELTTYSSHPMEEIARRRLACLILRERLLPVPYYAAKEARLGERLWITYQSGCYNE